MIFFSIILLFFSFLQATFLPLNLVFLILVIRSLVVDEKENFFLCFGFGLLLSVLLGFPVGSLSFVYLISALVVSFIKKTQSASRLIAILPLTSALLLFVHFSESFLLGTTFDPKIVVFETILALPLYFIITLWEERFIVRKEIKLKVGK